MPPPAPGALTRDTLRNGQNTQRQEYTPPNVDDTSATSNDNRRENDVSLDRGLHEPYDWYDACYTRERNQGQECVALKSTPLMFSLSVGLFTADQNLHRNRNGVSSAIYTRQNANGNRRGYECPEERDYYPYWHPTPWRDIAVLADNASLCDWYKSESNNRVPRGMCQETYSNGDPKYWSEYNNETQCINAGRKLLLPSILGILLCEM